MSKLKAQKSNVCAEGAKGFSIVEMIVVIAIVIVAFVAILQLAVLEKQTQTIAKESSRALGTARETIEAVRDARDNDWDNLSSLSTDANFHPATTTTATSTEWTLDNSGKESVGRYSRWFVVKEVCRDADDNIADCPASYTDADTLKIISRVEWSSSGGAEKGVKITTYLTNWQNHL